MKILAVMPALVAAPAVSGRLICPGLDDNRRGPRAEFLFDLREDPDETRDLAPMAGSAGDLNRCRGWRL
jgi:hypothetical protein